VSHTLRPFGRTVGRHVHDHAIRGLLTAAERSERDNPDPDDVPDAEVPNRQARPVDSSDLVGPLT
jgi:hypothetical protein